VWRIWLTAVLSLTLLTTPVAAGPAARSAATLIPRAPYLQRGDEVESRYQAHRERLERAPSIMKGASAAPLGSSAMA